MTGQKIRRRSRDRYQYELNRCCVDKELRHSSILDPRIATARCENCICKFGDGYDKEDDWERQVEEIVELRYFQKIRSRRVVNG